VTEDVEANDDAKAEAASGTVADHEHPLGMAMRSFTKEKMHMP
jgi:hypothetical protein